jgi:D-alanyl-D-alanine dipeptidase
VFRKEIVSCGFAVIAEPHLPELFENYIMVFAPVETDNLVPGMGWTTQRFQSITKLANANETVANLPTGFTYLHEVDSTIQVSLRYHCTENFLGEVVDGYCSDRVIMTVAAATALKNVQQDVRLDGYSVVIYDSFRPQRAVDHFVRWSESNDEKCDKMKVQYFPTIDRKDLFAKGYIARRSGHSRGSTVDLTLIASGSRISSSPVYTEREFQTNNGIVRVPYLDDNSVDMGTSFDLLDVASHPDCPFVPREARNMRDYLQQKMARHGFSGDDQEWWHFTLLNEPFPDTYHDFPIV